MVPPQGPTEHRAPDRQAAQLGADNAERWCVLMASAQDGDQEAYRVLLHEITPYLRAIARRYLGSGDGVEDAVQDILLTVHGIRHTYDRGRPFKPWLSTIASRRLIDLLRGRSRRLRHEVENLDAESIFDSYVIEPSDQQPDHVVARAQEVREMRRAVEGLSARQREAVVLLRFQELTLSEAALISKQSIGALKVACHRALKSLESIVRRDPEP
jgi:RNA polymerase sigma-70 factor, ECF subfamily